MVARHEYRNADGDLEWQTRVPRMGWEAKEAAEEGATPIVTITVDDPDMTLDYVGHRRWLIREPESEADDDVLFMGYTGSQTISRKGGDFNEPPGGRVWTIELVDNNTLWQRKVMTGADSKRPAESDVSRMQWLLGTNEATASHFENVTDYVNVFSPVSMDAVDYRGQTFAQVVDDCAQASGKNWFARYIFNPDTTDHELCAFYGNYTWDSPLSISNDPADIDMAAFDDGTAIVLPPFADTSLVRDPSRVFSHVYLPYDGGAVYRAKTATATAFALGGRDFIAPSINVKTKTKAAARALRMLNDLDSQDERVSTGIIVPASKATMARAGMRIKFKDLTFPGYEDFVWMRILNATPSPIFGGTWYSIALELQGPGTAAPAPLTCSIAMGNTDAATSDVPEPSSSGTMSLAVSPTYSGPTILIPVFSVTSGTPSIGAFSGGFSTLKYDTAVPTVALRIGFQAVTAPTTGTAGAAWAAYGDGGLLAVHAAIPSSATGVVQDNYVIGGSGSGLLSAPTAGNIVVMVCHAWGGNNIVGPGTTGPTTGWTLIGAVSNVATLPVPPYNAINRASLAVYARCAQAGDGTTYDFSVSGGFPGSISTYVAEFTP